uniref:TMC domain-containing protein n=1 Tax=Steinernema glaseri TaxID=37863 RepID=A0A1I7YCA8_9BILA
MDRYTRFSHPVDIPSLSVRDEAAFQRRPSMFMDFLTVFRRNTRSTVASSFRRRSPEVERRADVYHPRRPTLETTIEENQELLSETVRPMGVKRREADVFLGGGSGGGQKGDDDDEDDEGRPMTRQVLLDKIRKKKEVIGKLRCQAWNMNRKRRTLRLAQKYLQQHESRVSRSHLCKQEMSKMWRSFLRWASNVHIYFIPWEQKIKKIESHFGSVVSSYFTFLRWVVFVNICITFLIVAFIVVPEALADAAADTRRWNSTYSRKVIPPEERKHADELQVVWHFDGYLRYSPLFYGYYSNDDYVGTNVRYALPLAYFVITLLIFGYSFFAILRKMASNARMSKMAGSKAEQYIFNWKVFTGWDYTIGNSETAGNTIMAMIIKLRESIAESRVDKYQKFRCLQFTLRVFANAVILAMLAFSIYCISFAVQSSKTVEATGNLFTKNQVPTVVATITHVFPMIFDLIGKLENYHPRTALRAHLTRVLVLYVLNYMTLIIALFEKLDNIRDATRRDEEVLERSKRQMGGRNTNVERGLPFASRSFDDRAQFEEFLARASKRFETPTVAPPPRTTPSSGTSRLLGAGFTVQQQFGPVGVNHPKILTRNGSLPSGRRTFETRKLGPPTLKLFTPSPTTPPQEKTIKVQQEYGPEWKTGRRQKPIVFEKPTPRTTTSTSTSSTTTTTTTTTVAPTTTTTTRRRPSARRGEEVIEPEEEDPTELIMAATPDLLLEEPPTTQENLTDFEWRFLNLTRDAENDTAVQMGDSARVTTDGSVHYNDHICWETMIGQEIVKLVTMDLYITIASILLIDFARGIWVKYCSSWWCWDLETTFV